tara:strand:+ start:385 stop:909 length:525 start_codon:yes stop_codon:yes gene_type:complete
MKYLVKFFVVTSLYLICTYAFAEQKIAYIDMKYILNNSKAGKGAQDFLKKSFSDNQKRLAEKEKNLKKEENDLLSNKETLTKEEYKKKTDELRKKVSAYQAERRSVLEDLAKKRADAKNTLLTNIDPILKGYIADNGISLIVDKKHIIAGSTDLDLTKIIVEKLNKELPSLNLK